MADLSQKTDETEIVSDLHCIICTEPFAVPVTLDCGHTYCQICLMKTVKRKAACPNCRKKIKKIPAVNFVLKSMLERQCGHDQAYAARVKESEAYARENPQLLNCESRDRIFSELVPPRNRTSALSFRSFRDRRQGPLPVVSSLRPHRVGEYRRGLEFFREPVRVDPMRMNVDNNSHSYYVALLCTLCDAEESDVRSMIGDGDARELYRTLTGRQRSRDVQMMEPLGPPAPYYSSYGYIRREAERQDRRRSHDYLRDYETDSSTASSDASDPIPRRSSRASRNRRFEVLDIPLVPPELDAGPDVISAAQPDMISAALPDVRRVAEFIRREQDAIVSSVMMERENNQNDQSGAHAAPGSRVLDRSLYETASNHSMDFESDVDMDLLSNLLANTEVIVLDQEDLSDSLSRSVSENIGEVDPDLIPVSPSEMRQSNPSSPRNPSRERISPYSRNPHIRDAAGPPGNQQQPLRRVADPPRQRSPQQQQPPSWLPPQMQNAPSYWPRQQQPPQNAAGSGNQTPPWVRFDRRDPGQNLDPPSPPDITTANHSCNPVPIQGQRSPNAPPTFTSNVFAPRRAPARHNPNRRPPVPHNPSRRPPVRQGPDRRDPVRQQPDMRAPMRQQPDMRQAPEVGRFAHGSGRNNARHAPGAALFAVRTQPPRRAQTHSNAHQDRKRGERWRRTEGERRRRRRDDDRGHGDRREDDRGHGDWREDDRGHGDWREDDRGHGDWREDDRGHGDWREDDRGHGDWREDDRGHGDWRDDDRGHGDRRDHDRGHGDWREDDRGNGGWREDDRGNGGWREDDRGNGGWREGDRRKDSRSRRAQYERSRIVHAKSESSSPDIPDPRRGDSHSSSKSRRRRSQQQRHRSPSVPSTPSSSVDSARNGRKSDTASVSPEPGAAQNVAATVPERPVRVRLGRGRGSRSRGRGARGGRRGKARGRGRGLRPKRQ